MKWQFEYAPDDDGRGQWHWVRVLDDGRREASDRTFDSFRACEAHAARHGYLEDSPPRAPG